MIRIGTMIRSNGGKAPRRLEPFLTGGFESFQFHWWETTGDENLNNTADIVQGILQNADIEAKLNLGLYGNPLLPGERGEASRKSIKQLLYAAQYFGSPVLGLFTGRLTDRPWDESLPVFSNYFENLCREAADHGVKLAMENCPMDGNDEAGDWNLAHSPRHWQKLYDSLSSTAGDNLYLEWEPAHQILQGFDPIDSLTNWRDRIIHVHGKDATEHRGSFLQTLPGNGSTDWHQVHVVLEENGYSGTMDIEGYHDKDWSGTREIEGQVKSLGYLKNCQAGQTNGPRW